MTLKLLLLMIFVGGAGSAFAGDFFSLSNKHLKYGLGLDVGNSFLSTKYSNEVGTQGSVYQGHLRALYNPLTDGELGRWWPELSFGAASVSQSATDPILGKVRIRVNYLIFDGALQREFSPSFFAGPYIQLGYGPDMSFIQDNDTLNTRTLTSIGLKLSYHRKFEEPLLNFFDSLRTGLKIQNSISIANRNFTQTTVFLELYLKDFVSVATPQVVTPSEAPPIPTATQRPQTEVISAPLPTAKEEVQVQLNERSINFTIGKSKLTPEAKKFVAKMGQFLAQHPSDWTQLVIEGHTDSKGKAAANLKLSQARAEAVKKELVAQKNPEGRIYAKGYGSEKPLVEGADPSSQSKNRRVTLKFFGFTNAAVIEPGLQALAK